MKHPLIAITGGIGSGKSVVAKMLATIGYPVFDCDREAKQIMDNSAEIKRRIAEEISQDCITADGCIDRRALSAAVFADDALLQRLNAIVHESVRSYLRDWAGQATVSGPAFVETAILYQSGLDRMVDRVVEVVAPDEIRIERVMKRNSLPREEVISRIEAQRIDVARPHPFVTLIDNSGAEPLLPQLLSYLQSL